MQKSGGAATLMKDEKITVFAGGWNGQEITGKVPFEEKVMSFLDELSREIPNHPETADSNEVVSFAFWCRKKHLEQWKKSMCKNETRIGLGMIFHIAPSNIPALFAYSMVLGMLSGNGNLVRISNRVSKEALPLCRIINEVMKRPEYEEIYQRNKIITYDHDQELNEKYSRLCDGRVIWGGNHSIEEIRKANVAPGTPQLEFADRCSVAVMNFDWMGSLQEEELEILAHQFYNDTLVVDQNACSSPAIVFWVGKTSENIEEIQRKWWEIFARIADQYDLSPWKVSRKYEQLCSMIMEHREIQNVWRWKNRIYVMNLKEIPKKPEQYIGRFGSFFQYHLTELEQLGECLNRNVQTVICAGIQTEIVRDIIVRCGCKGGDRVVNIGQALSLNRIWDGKDILKSMSRIVD